MNVLNKGCLNNNPFSREDLSWNILPTQALYDKYSEGAGKISIANPLPTQILSFWNLNESTWTKGLLGVREGELVKFDNTTINKLYGLPNIAKDKHH